MGGELGLDSTDCGACAQPFVLQTVAGERTCQASLPRGTPQGGALPGAAGLGLAVWLGPIKACAFTCPSLRVPNRSLTGFLQLLSARDRRENQGGIKTDPRFKFRLQALKAE